VTNTLVPITAIKGRGTATHLAHRFSTDDRAAFDDGWGTLENVEPRRPLTTQVIFEDAHSAISRNDSPDIYFDYGLNPYRGCEHGCVYCYARPTHSYLNLSPGLDFETKIIAKRNLAEVLARIHDMRGGKDYNADFATRMQGSGLWADLLGQRFHKTCAKLGLNRERVELDVAQFRPGLLSGQDSLF